MIDVRQFSSDKILSHFDRINEWIEKGISSPVTYELDLTNACNNNCPFCFGYHKREESKASINLNKAKSIISQIQGKKY